MMAREMERKGRVMYSTTSLGNKSKGGHEWLREVDE